MLRDEGFKVEVAGSGEECLARLESKTYELILLDIQRKPMVWADLPYDDETTHPFGQPRRHDKVEPDMGLHDLHRELIDLGKRHLRLFVDGGVKWLVTDDARGVLAYARTLGDQQAVVAFNTSARPQQVTLPADGRYHRVFPLGAGAGDATRATLPPQSARVWIRERP